MVQASPARPGTVYLVGAGPGDPDLLTLRGAELLSSADAVLHDELSSPELLELARPDALLEYVGKRGDEPAEKQLRQSQIDARILELARGGRSVVRLKGGDPFLFGRGSEEAESLADAGVPYEIVPGVTSPIAAAAYAGISLTHRDLASSVVFLSGTTREGQAFDFKELAGHKGTVCVLMGLRRLGAIADALVRDAGRAPSTPAAVVSAGTRPAQRVVVGTLEDIAARVVAARLPTPALVVVGDVVSLRERLRWYDAWPLFDQRVVVTRAEHQAAGLARLLLRRGARPIELPLLAIEAPPDEAPVERAAREVGSYDLVIFTSENGAERFFHALRGVGRDARAFGAALVACVGEGTAKALARRGITPDIVPATFRGEALADAICAALERRPGGAAGARALLPRALVAREVLPDTLRARGVDVDVVAVYQTVKKSPDALVELLERRGADVLLLTASSAVDAICDALGERLGALTEGLLVASIGAVTSETASRRGLRVDVTADKSTTTALVDAVERAIGAQSRAR
ncbi:MAG: uroporphyrinogen-III C-methyltransferase [Polyangiaceae bacterium]|nr:uroporphyrinogen-III C-methyltransferase [Polyangiaceae bacterium]MBK8940492.1 uroporphyrinogen-III C-methyltransferase [Polyangiaceae bacterium]